MKCRICGYELEPDVLFCPFCGSKTGTASESSRGSMFESPDIQKAPGQRKAPDEEISWNTYDFPKPRELRDIKMEWSGVGMMNDDASEGFVSSGQDAAEAARQQAPSWHMPEQKPVPGSQLWFSPIGGMDPSGLPPNARQFTATGYVSTEPVRKAPEQPSRPVVSSFEEKYGAEYREKINAGPAAEQAPEPVSRPLDLGRTEAAGDEAYISDPGIVGPAAEASAEAVKEELSAEDAFDAIIYSVPSAVKPAAEPGISAAPEQAPEAAGTYAEPDIAPEPAYPEKTPDPVPASSSEATERLASVEQIIGAPPASETPGQPRMFKTFYTKNEEFQKLLDQEYQRMIERGEKIGFPHPQQAAIPPEPELQNLSVIPAQTSAPVPPESGEAAEASGVTASAASDAEISDFERMLMEGTQSGGKDDATIPIRLSGLHREGGASDIYLADAQTKKIGGAVIAASLAAAERAAEKAAAEPLSGIIPAGNSDIRQAEPEINETPFAELSASIGPEAFVRSTIEMKLKELHEQEKLEDNIREQRRKRLEDMRKAREAIFGTETSPQDMEAVRAAAEEARSGIRRKRTEDAAAAGEKIAAAEKEPAEEKADTDNYSEEERRRHPFLTLVLILLIIAVLFEGGLGLLRRYMPDSGVTRAAALVEEAVADFVMEGYSRTSDFIRGLFNRDPGAEDVPEAAGSSGYDFISVVENNNRNIENVVLDADLRREAGADYGVEGLEAMSGEGRAEVLDAVYGAMIAYNSKWIDYVNDGKDDVLDLLKADGNAYFRAVNFDQIGQISESFEKLALGEVVSDGSTAYVFDRETIAVTLDGETSSQTRTWLYELVKVGEEYKIVDYNVIE